jgi:hypothetical protein
VGKILAGILSPVSGKVAGVVGGKWKNIAYLRAHVIPANPNSADQQVQRTMFSDCVAFAKPLVGLVFNPYTDKFIAGMSGFNFFIKKNIEHFTTSPHKELVKITEGKLYMGGTTATTTYDDVSGALTVFPSTEVGGNGLPTDLVKLVVYNKTDKIVYPVLGSDVRSAGEVTAVIPTGLASVTLCAYFFAVQITDGKLIVISNSIQVEKVLP